MCVWTQNPRDLARDLGLLPSLGGFHLEDWIFGRDKTSGSHRQRGPGGHEPLE